MPSVYRTVQGRQAVEDWCAERIAAWPVVHEHITVPTRAGRTSAVIAGAAPNGHSPRTVVLVPGTSTCAALYLKIAEALAPRWRTVLLDVPGQPGLSAPWRPRRGHLAWYGQWLTEALEATVGGPALVLGHSLGGAIALACDSELIVGRILLATAGLTRLSVPLSVTAATVPWLLRPSPARSARLLAHMLAPGNRVPDELAEWMTLVARYCRTSLAPDALDAEVLAQRGTTPCTVATGSHDVFLPPRRLAPAAGRYLGVGLQVLEGSGHLLLDEEPHRLVELVAQHHATA